MLVHSMRAAMSYGRGELGKLQAFFGLNSAASSFGQVVVTRMGNVAKRPLLHSRALKQCKVSKVLSLQYYPSMMIMTVRVS